MDSRTRCSVLISFHRRLRDRDESPSLLPVTTAGVPPMRPGRRRRPPRRYACPPARTRRAAEPGRQRVPAPFERCCACDETRGHEREQPAEIGQIGFRVHPHEQQVVALGHHVLVHLVRALRRGQQVQPVLAPFRGDLHDRVRGEPIDLVAGSAEQMLCASSTTTRQGSRECRDRHSVDRTAWVTSCSSAAVPSDPRSTTVHRAVGSRSSATSEGCCGSQMLQSNKPMLRARRSSARAPGRSGQQAARCR